MKKMILIRAIGTENWIGGLYYRRNIVFSLMQNEKIRERVVVFVSEENAHLFRFGNLVPKIIVCKGTRSDNDKKVLLYIIKNHGAYVFPGPKMKGVPSIVKKLIGIKPIMWIPDFQHKKFPDMFNSNQINDRDEEYSGIARSSCPLVLSSNDSKNDFIRYYSKDKKNIYVIPFVSYIEEELKSITSEKEEKVLQKHNLVSRKYVCVMNQFWKHKNHDIVLKALKIIHENNPNSSLVVVFTGKLYDDRNSDYIDNIREEFKRPEIEKHTKLLGFIERVDQLILMKNAKYIIQPSLCEGWGTVVEDAKVLEKTILLSDIPVHREQRNEKCILFDPYDAKQLAMLMEREFLNSYDESIEHGIIDMYERAFTYSKLFEEIITNY